MDAMEDPPTRTKVIVASRNPVQIQAGSDGFSRMFPNVIYNIVGVDARSNVPNQPYSDKQTLLGAQNRSNNTRTQYPEADFWVGFEGGGQEHGDELQSFAWVVVVGKCGRIGKARTATCFLPKETAALLKQGMELGHADDRLFGTSNSKQNQGSVGLLTGAVVDRLEFYVQAVILALVPFKQRGLTFETVTEA